jgi:hypothetical protein
MIPVSSRFTFARRVSRAIPALLLVASIGCAGSETEPDANVQDQDITTTGGDYEKKTALEKQALLWTNMTSNEYCKLPAATPDPAPYNLGALKAFASPVDDKAFYKAVQMPEKLAASASEQSYLSSKCQGALAAAPASDASTKDRVRALFAQSKAFDHSADEMDAGRHKIIHVHGSAAAVAFQTNNGFGPKAFGETGPRPRYSGLLAPGQQIPGILRIGEVGVPLGDPIFGAALKLFVDGQPSRNIHGMTRINGQPNRREPFALPVTNMLLFNQGTNRGIVGVLKMLQMVKPDSLQVPIDHFARIMPDGRDLFEGVSYPHEVSFTPEPRVADAVHQLLADNPTMDIRQAFRAIPVGTVLYRVTARRNGPGGVCNDFVEIGRVVLVSPLVASPYEDQTLFFRHNRGKWRAEDKRHVSWMPGEREDGAVDVNVENRNLVTQDCKN